MTRRTRRIILFLVITFFFIATPLILSYAFGYTFDWQKKRPVLTGGFYFKSIPKKINVYLNDELEGISPIFIKRLSPKYYQIELRKEGYYTWHKTLKIESKMVTEARNILLIPKKPKTEIIDSDLPNNFSLDEFLTEDEKEIPANIFYIQKQSNILYKTDPDGMNPEQISLTPLLQDQEYEIFVSSNEEIALLAKENKRDTTAKLYLFDQETRGFNQIADDVRLIQFSDDNKKLLYLTNNEIWVYYLEDILSQPIKQAGEKELITRSSQKIKLAKWYFKTNEHILFIVNSTLKIIEIDGRDKRNAFDILTIDIDDIGYRDKDKKLYITTPDRQLIGLSLEDNNNQ